MSFFKVEAVGDTMYIEAENQDEAQQKLFDFTGPIPESILVWSRVDALPDGEELL